MAARDAAPALAEAVLRAHARVAGLGEGRVATYIPELARADPGLCGVALCTTAGEVHVAGDAGAEFTLQSLSKPFVYASALDRLSPERVHRSVGVEPTGFGFDSFVRLTSGTGRPHNPMVNAGAIAVSGMHCSDDRSGDVRRMLLLFEACAGRELPGIDVPVYLSERATGHRNRAIAYLLRHFGALTEDVEAALDLYFQQCSVLATCRDLAVMAATLAAGGRNPVTGRQVLSPGAVRDALAVMSTCGLYDDAGRFLFEVGLPAKSGVSGGVVAVAPGRMGLAAFSPRLDGRGNSVRGVAAMRLLSGDLGLHVFEPRPVPPDPAPDLRPRFEEFAARVRSLDPGRPADYIAPLAAADPERFALCAVTVTGAEAAIGDADHPFSAQAVANALAYTLAAERHGLDAVQTVAGLEPSGNPYHAILLDPRTNRPFNPLGNAGAIAVCSLESGADPTEQLSRRLQGLAGLAGGERPAVDAPVLAAERAAGDRNRAIASLLRAFGVLEDEVGALDLYLQQCSIRTSCRILARMAATLAAGGVEPRSGSRVLRAEVVRSTLSLMYACGVHDESGQLAYDAGVPCKSGVSGGLLAVVPGRYGIAAYGAGINASGTSVRGRAALVALARELRLGVFDPPPDRA